MAIIPFSTPNPRTGGRTNIPGMNTTAVLYYQPGSPFNDVLKQSEDIVRPDGQNRDFDGDRTPNGYPTTVGSAVNWVGFYFASGLGNDRPTGRYVLSWSGGSGVKPSISGLSPVVDEEFRRVYDIPEWNTARAIRIKVSDIRNIGESSYAADPIVSMRLEEEALEGTTGYGEPNFLREKWVDSYKNFAVRMMNFQATNQQDGNTDWESRRTKSYRTYTHGRYDKGTNRHTPAGVPLDVALEIGNTLGTPTWVCVPHGYTDDAVRKFAQYAATNYKFKAPLGIEYSNEAWNGMFPQNAYMQAEGLREDSRTGRYGGSNYPFWSHYVFRSTQVARIIADELDRHGKDFCPIICPQTGNTWQSRVALFTNVAEDLSGEKELASKYCKTVGANGYFGGKVLREPFLTSRDLPGTMGPTVEHEPDMSEIYAHMEYMIDVFHRDIEARDSWAANRKNFVDAGFDEVLIYEGNHHVRWEGRGRPTDWAKEIVSQYETTKFQQLHRSGLRAAEEIMGADTYMHFVLVSAREPGGYWGYYETLEDFMEPDGRKNLLGDSFRDHTGLSRTFSI